MQTHVYRFFRTKTQVAAPRDFRFARVIIKPIAYRFDATLLGPVLTWKHFNVENQKLPITPFALYKIFEYSHILNIHSAKLTENIEQFKLS